MKRNTTTHEEIRNLIRQGYSNKQIQDKLFVTYSQIIYQRKKLIKENSNI